MDRVEFLHIIQKYLAGTITPDEEKTLLKMIDSSEEYKILFKQETAGWVPPATDEVYDEKWKRLVSNIRPLDRPDVRRYTISRYMRIAAVITLLLAGGLATYWLNHAKEEQAYAWVTMLAETDDEIVWLPDSSSVYVRKGSQLVYFSDPSVKERIVQLEGEAFFDVKHNPSQPFRVEAGELQVNVLGTSFSVDTRTRAESISVILVEGKVSLSSNRKEPVEILEPGQQADFFVADGSCVISEVDSDRQTLWRKGIIVYENSTIEDIVGLLSVHYHTDLEWKLPSGTDERFSGAFLKTQSLSTVVEQIEKLTGAKITPVSD
ncbi:MAG: FecR domain-containing protein [Tannerellaceae bacterium]|nr:FecR domain-containing protein [Tannerellaceae bacterium]